MVPLEELEEYPRKSRWRRTLIPLAVGAAIAVGLVFVLQPADETPEAKELGSFELPLLEGGTLTDEDLRGQPVVVNFFASWCPPCREEAEVLQATFEKYEDRVQFIGVDIRDTPEDAQSFVNEFGVTYPIVKDYDEVLAKRLGVGLGIPQTFFLSEALRVSATEAGDEVGSANGNTTLGAIEADELEAGIEKILGDPAS
jgi:cytochrome c biogenesis protein CcmG, thiol:disulfide interchange protein DsbE